MLAKTDFNLCGSTCPFRLPPRSQSRAASPPAPPWRTAWLQTDAARKSRYAGLDMIRTHHCLRTLRFANAEHLQEHTNANFHTGLISWTCVRVPTSVGFIQLLCLTHKENIERGISQRNMVLTYCSVWTDSCLPSSDSKYSALRCISGISAQ